MLGFYMPSMFHLHVHTELPLNNLDSWDDTTLCTFFHEYIHYLQDVSTVMGLYNIYTLGEALSDSVNSIYRMPNGKVHVPIAIQPGQNNVANNIMVLDETSGDYSLPYGVDEDTLQVTGKASEVSKPTNLNGQVVDLHEVRVPFNGGDFLLGSFHISESMAYLAECIVYGAKPGVVEPSPNFPYDIVRQLAAFYDPALGNNLPLQFALCDFSLTFSHPAHALVSFMQQYVNEGSTADWMSFVRSLVNRTNVQGTSGINTYKQGILSIAKLALDSLDKRFKGWNYYDVYQWYHTIIGGVIKKRLDNPLFLTDLVMAGDLKSNDKFKEILGDYGTPVLSDDFNNTYMYNCSQIKLKKKRAMLLMAAGSITYALIDGEIPCMLRKYCQADKRCVSKDCVRAPWKKARRFCPCPYGYLWYGWKLRKYELCW